MSAEIRSLIEAMRQAVLTESSADAELLRDEASEYSEWCHRANIRLTEASALLQKGLRDEAILMSEKDGQLLDLVQALDFPERAQWVGLVTRLNMDAPPPIDTNAASLLNAAYADINELQPLLRANRLLALTRAPLSRRISVLRELNAEDPFSPVWQEDLTVFEKSRHKELAQEVDIADKADQLDDAVQLHREITSDDWTVAPPAALAQHAAQSVNRLRRADVRTEMVTTRDSLLDSYTQFDAERGIEMASTLREHMSKLKIDLSDADLLEAQPALQWADEQAQQIQWQKNAERSAAQLEEALMKDAPREELERLLRETLPYQDAVPQPLRMQAQDRISGHEQVARRRFFALSATGFVTVVLIAGLAIWMVTTTLKRARVAEIVRAHQIMIDKEQWNQAVAYFDKLPEELRSLPEMTSGHQKAVSGIQSEVERAKRFTVTLDLLKENDSPEPDFTTLRELRELAVTDSEKADLALQEKIANDKNAALLAAKNNQFLSDLQKLRTQYNAASSSQAPLAQRLRSLKATQQAVQRFRSANSQVSKPLLAQSESLESRIGDSIAAIEAEIKEADTLKTITKTVGLPEPFRNSLLAYCDLNPDSKRSAQFKKIADAPDAWQGFVDATDSFSEFSISDLTTLTPERGATMGKALNAHQHLLRKLPGCEEIEDAMNYIRSAGKRKEAEAEIRALLTDAALTGIHYYKMKDRVYYGPPPRTGFEALATGHFPKFEYYFDFTLKVQVKNNGQFSNDNSTVMGAGLSAQSQFAAEAKTLLTRFRSPGSNYWENATFRLVRLIQGYKGSGPEMPPTLRLMLLRKLITAGGSGSTAISTGLSPILTEFENDRIDWDANWIFPTTRRDNEARNNARRFVAQLSPVGDFARDIAAEIAKVKNFQLPRVEWIGWLANISGNWQVMGEGLVQEGELLVVTGETKATIGTEIVVPAQANAGARPLPIKVQGSDKLQEGMPVFQIRRDNQEPTE